MPKPSVSVASLTGPSRQGPWRTAEMELEFPGLMGSQSCAVKYINAIFQLSEQEIISKIVSDYRRTNLVAMRGSLMTGNGTITFQ